MSRLQTDSEVKYLTEEQIGLFFRAVKGIRDRALFRVIYHRGLRASEPGLLLISDWDAAAGTLWVRRKKGSACGRYHLVAIEAAALRAWIRIRGTGPGPLFVSRKHQAISRDQVHDLMRRYCQLAGIPAGLAHPHALKHSCGTHVLARVNDLVKVQDHLGHKSIQSTEIYAKVLGRTRAEVADRLRDWK